MNDLKSFFRSFPTGLWLLMLIVFLAILGLPALLIRPGLLDFTETGQIGDTIGGIMGPFIAIVAAFLTFFAFWAQFLANNELINENRRNHFENRFYKMLDIHLESVANLNTRFAEEKDKPVNSCFQSWCEEIMNMYNTLYIEGDLGGFVDLVKKKYKNDPDMTEYVDFLTHIQESRDEYERVFFEITYSYFFSKEFSTLKHGDNKQTQYTIQFATTFSTYLIEKNILKLDGNAKNEILGRYYRHLFQIVRYVDEQPDNLYEDKDWKSGVLSILRSQMSDYEQLLLYYNAQSSLGHAWDEKHYIEKYRLIKNIPFSDIFACAGLAPFVKYQETIKAVEAKGEKFFERG